MCLLLKEALEVFKTRWVEMKEADKNLKWKILNEKFKFSTLPVSFAKRKKMGKFRWNHVRVILKEGKKKGKPTEEQNDWQ